MKACIEDWNPDTGHAVASLESEGREEMWVQVRTYEIEEPRGWHTERTDPAIRVDEVAEVMDENGNPCDRMELSDDAREAIEDALGPQFQEALIWRGIDAAAP